MLKEFKNLRQEKVTSRKLFTDDFFDLYFWYKKDYSEIIGFQLIYAVNETQMAFTYYPGRPAKIQAVDNMENSFNPSPILNGPGIFLKQDLIFQFEVRSSNLDKELKELVLDVLKTYNP